MKIINLQLIGVGMQFLLLIEQIILKDNSFIGIIAIMIMVLLLNFVDGRKA